MEKPTFGERGIDEGKELETDIEKAEKYNPNKGTPEETSEEKQN